MSPIALALVAIAALAHALWNRRLHVAGDRLATIAIAYLAIGIALLPARCWMGRGRSGRCVPLRHRGDGLLAVPCRGLPARRPDDCLPARSRHGALLVTLGGWLILGARQSPRCWWGP